MIGKFISALQFLGLYLKQLVRSNIFMASITLSPRLKIKYGFIQIPLVIKSEFGLLVFSNLVSMTPGSLITDIDSSKKKAIVHVIFSTDEKQTYKELERMQNSIKKFID